MTGREYLVIQSVLHILDNNPSDLSDSRIWEVIEDVISKVERHKNPTFHDSPKRHWVMRYWYSITDPDGMAANRLVNEIKRTVEKRLAYRRTI